MSSAADLLNVERSYLWVVETPRGSNRTIIGEKYGWNGVAWCAEFVSVSQKEAGVPWNRSASCSVLVGRFQAGENGTWLGNPGAGALLPGDIGFLGTRGQDHVFTVELVDGDIVHCIDGNWADRVIRVERPIHTIFGFGRPNYDGAVAPGLPPASATGGRPWLRLGSTGQAVIDLKRYLNAFAQAGLGESATFDAATDTALRAYQSSRQLEVDGVAGPQTYADMDAVIAFVSGLAAPHVEIPPFPGTVKLGSHGAAARAFQQRLRGRGWRVAVDGVFGPKSVAALKAFQEEKGLVNDGIGGPKSWLALWAEPVT